MSQSYIKINGWQLINNQQEPVKKGQIINHPNYLNKDLQFELMGGEPPKNSSSIGKVYGTWIEDGNRAKKMFANPNLFNLIWVKAGR